MSVTSGTEAGGESGARVTDLMPLLSISRIDTDRRPGYHIKMDDNESSTGGKIPAGWVRCDPEKPLYEVRHLCMYLSDLEAYFSIDPEGDPGKGDP